MDVWIVSLRGSEDIQLEFRALLGPPEVSVGAVEASSWKPDFSATIRLSRSPSKPWPAFAPEDPSPGEPVPAPPAMNTRSGTSGCVLLLSCCDTWDRA